MLTKSKPRAHYCHLTALGKKDPTADRQCRLRLVRAVAAIIEPEVQS